VAAKLQPESQKLPCRFRATSCDRDFFTGRTGGREDETEARIFGVCAAARELATPSLLLNLGGIFFNSVFPN
jgi:hypothetical protein